MVMKTDGVVLTRIVADAQRSLEFYRDGLGMAEAKIMDGIVWLALPGLTLFLSDAKAFSRNTGMDPGTLGGVGGAGSDGLLSCAIASTEEVDGLLDSALAAGGTVSGPRTLDHSSGHRQYIGTVTDPDGYLWQLVCNISEP